MISQKISQQGESFVKKFTPGKTYMKYWQTLKFLCKIKGEYMCLKNYTFWENFWPDLIAGSIVALIFAPLIIWFIDFIKKPKDLEFIWRGSRSDTIKANKQLDGKYNFIGELAIKHKGGRLWAIGSPFMKNIYWHILIPEEIKVDIQPFENNPQPLDENLPDKNTGKVYRHLRDSFKTPLYPNSSLNLNFKLVGSFDDFENKEIYYFFSTEFGRYPSTIVESNNIVEMKNNSKILKIVTS